MFTAAVQAVFKLCCRKQKTALNKSSRTANRIPRFHLDCGNASALRRSKQL
jgi:hypothetical protein